MTAGLTSHATASTATALTLVQLNAAPQAEFTALLDGLYEHSAWIAEAAWQRRPFASLAALEHALVLVLREAGRDAQLSLIRAHPELAGKAMIAKALTVASTDEQGRAGLADCTPQEFERLQQLNAAYNARFGWPFILAVRGPRGTGLARSQIIATFERRLGHHAEVELAECVRQVHRIAQLRLNDRLGVPPSLGNACWDRAAALAVHTEAVGASDAAAATGAAETGGELTVTYLTEAHRACAAQLAAWMRDDGFDEVSVDAVGNVVGVYHSVQRGADDSAASERTDRTAARPRVLTGSHYDTVRNAGPHDGRLGILVPMATVRALHVAGRRLPFGIEVIGFAEEEGQRYPATFLGSSALAGQFDATWLDQRDADGIPMRDAMRAAGLPATLDAIAPLRRDPAAYLGFVEVHIEQGPVLNALDLPLGVVTSINGSVRFIGEVIGTASHAGTTPMAVRRDAACAVAELALCLERRASSTPNLVATMGVMTVPNGSVNVVPGRCRFTLDIRATTDAVRDACVADMLAELGRICERRGLAHTLDEVLRASAAPSDAAWQRRWEDAVEATGVPVFRLPSGAGHDAMKLHAVMPQAMLFVRGENAGISHNPLESTTADDMQLAVEAFGHLLERLASEA